MKLIVGVRPEPPGEVRAYCFDERAGNLLAELDAQIATRPTEIVCAFSLPLRPLTDRLCVVIEGRWRDGRVAGCEMSFELDH